MSVYGSLCRTGQRRNRMEGLRGIVSVTVFLSGLALFALAAGAQDGIDLSELKEAIKKELLQELRGESAADSSKPSFIQQMKEEIKRELLEELRNDTDAAKAAAENVQNQRENGSMPKISHPEEVQERRPHPQAAKLASSANGDAEGYILRSGRGLGGCQVKLVTLYGGSGRFQGYTQGEEFVSVTDNAGKYRFQRIPVGNYKLKWQLPGDTGWIRRLWDRPDVYVTKGQLNTLKAVETARPLVPR